MSKAAKQQENVDLEELLVEQAKRIRALHAIISRPDLSFEGEVGPEDPGLAVCVLGKLPTADATRESEVVANE